MEFLNDALRTLRQMDFRQFLHQSMNLGLIVTSALMIWKTLMLITGSESPVVVVLSGSMEPGFQRGDILFLYMGSAPIRTGEIVVYKVEDRDIPIVHRAIKIHEERSDDPIPNAKILTKGDHNPGDDRSLYPPGQLWLKNEHIMGRAIGFFPYLGMVTIIMNDYPYAKYVLIGCLALMVLTSKE